MKKIKTKAKKNKYVVAQNGYFRRFIRQLFVSWIKRHNCHYLGEQMDIMMETFKDVESAINNVAHEVARWSKRME